MVCSKAAGGCRRFGRRWPLVEQVVEVSERLEGGGHYALVDARGIYERVEALANVCSVLFRVQTALENLSS